MPDVDLQETLGGYTIVSDGEQVGFIEGVPGYLEYLTVELPWEDQGIGRSAVRAFAQFSHEAGHEELGTTNTTHEAMTHILETEGFERREDDGYWVQDLESYLEELKNEYRRDAVLEGGDHLNAASTKPSFCGKLYRSISSPISTSVTPSRFSTCRFARFCIAASSQSGLSVPASPA